jgi:hypothetical protein
MMRFVKTTKPKAAAAARIGAALARRRRTELLELLRPCFARTEPWLQAGKYAAVVMSLWGAKTALAASDLQLPEAAGGVGNWRR